MTQEIKLSGLANIPDDYQSPDLLERECLVPEFPIRDISKDIEITVIGNIYDNPELVKILTQHNK